AGVSAVAPGGAAANAAPIKLLILALGGEGGGALADLIVDAAQRQGFPVQSTSIPGVAQRTGATSYYIELLPVPAEQLGGARPVFSLTPLAGDLDLIVSSELLETGRAIEAGLPSPERTLLISSTSRFLTVAERMQMADGRYDGDRIAAAARKFAQRAVLFDMAAEAQRHRTVVSAVMFGAIVASGKLPLSRDVCEAAIADSVRGVDATLAGFEAGFDATMRADAAAAPVRDGRARLDYARAVALGTARCADFQDDAYAQLYRQRCERIAAAERDAGGGPKLQVAAVAARFLALWMAYEDTIRVADLKSRPQRLQRIRDSVGARDGEPVTVREFLKPGVDEIAAVLPPRPAGWLLRWGQRRRRSAIGEGMRLATTSVHGYLMLRLLAAMRPLRRRSSRFADEQALIERWLDRLLAALERAAAAGVPERRAAELALAREIAECPRLLKGYGDTHRRGRRSFDAILQDLIERDAAGEPQALAESIRRARQAALAEPEGRELARVLGRPLPEPTEHPVRIVRRPRPVPRYADPPKG
ncbi:MAG TPA: DUF6537 domain-containing protein, partial [Burkholderiaceae bacterium]|nr:DUF6537 domain-containing protein [Burkholderiaceae bacterium]